jgi:hypothetical protein
VEQKWFIDIVSPGAAEPTDVITLSWQPTEIVNDHYVLFSGVGEDTGAVVEDLRDVGTYVIEPAQERQYYTLLRRGARSAVDNDEVALPYAFRLDPSYPNPSNPATTISFELARACHVRLVLYNMLGQIVATLTSGYYDAGPQQVEWTGTDDNGHMVSSGVYLYRLEAGDFVATQKLVLIR